MIGLIWESLSLVIEDWIDGSICLLNIDLVVKVVAC